MSSNFRVDLSGVVELLSRNLYSGPRVFIRELLQNGVDAITARRELQPDCPAQIRFLLSGRTLTVIDSGVGLTADEAASLLSTIGASSKKDEFGLSRSDFLGQFGIGLLSCFMVSPSIEVFSSSVRAAEPGLTGIVRWVGSSDGTWTIDDGASFAVPAHIESALSDGGTAIVLEGFPGEQLFSLAALRDVITSYGRFLEVDVTLEGGSEVEHLALQRPPWEMAPASRAQATWCAENFGFMPFAAIPLDVPEAGFKGVAYVLESGANPGHVMRHQVYLRRMLLGSSVTSLLPDWAYFVRVVGNAEFLKPTASREDLFDDDLVELTRQAIGEHIRVWLTQLAAQEPAMFKAFTALHINGLKSLALTDRPTRELLCRTVPFMTTLGAMTIGEIIDAYGGVRYVSTDDQFRTIEPIAAANEVCVLNAGFAFDQELIGQLALDYPQVRFTALRPSDLLGVLSSLPPDEEAELMPFVDAASKALAGQNVEMSVRRFEPGTLPVLFLPDGDVAGARVEGDAAASSSPLAALVESAASQRSPQAGVSSPQLVFNAHSPVVFEMAGAVDRPEVLDSAVRGLYVQALLAGRHPMDSQVRSWSTSVFSTLISRALK